MIKFLLLATLVLLELVSPMASMQADEKGVVTKAMIQPGYVWKRIHIKWGILTKSHQIWDGHAEIDSGHILKVNPFIRRDLLDDSKLVTETSWKSETYTDIEGIFLTVYAPPPAIIRIVTRTHTFAFSIEDLEKKKQLVEMDGDIEIEDQTEEILFRIKGLEYGEYGTGTATISPRVAYVDSVGTWTLTYTAGPDGIPVGGGIRISWHFTRTWGTPQYSDPRAPDYVTAHTSGRAKLDYDSEHRGLFEYPFNQGRILVRLQDHVLNPGEQITVVLGDPSQGSPGFQTSLVSEKDFTFRVEVCTEVPETGFPVYRRLRELPKITVKTLFDPQRFFAVAPSIVHPSQPFSLKLVAEDKYRNTCEGYSRDVQIHAESTDLTERLGTYQITAGVLQVDDLQLPTTGVWRIIVKSDDGVLGKSNPILCGTEDKHEMYWGELHGHTRYSDGYGSGDDYFQFARTKAFLDFAAITDHDVELDAPDYKVSEMWEEVNAAVAHHHAPPHFLTLLAYEWSPARITETTKYPFGDHNVLYFQKHGYIFPTGAETSNTLRKLYQRLKELPLETLVKVIPHVGGAIGNWEIHDPDLEPLGEIYSVHGSFEDFGQIALDRGYRIGFVGAADAHNGQIGGFPPGNSVNHFVHGGLTAILADELSRKSLYEAVSKRRVYATTGKRILLDFELNGEKMGSDVASSTAPRIIAKAVGEKPIWKLELIKNGQVIHSIVNSVVDSTLLTILWRNHVDKSELRNFDEGFWSRKLRAVHWSGSLSCKESQVELLSTCSFDFPKDQLVTAGTDSIVWSSETRGDYDGVRVRLRDPDSPLVLRLTRQQFGTATSAKGFQRMVKGGEQGQLFTISPTEVSPAGEKLRLGPLDVLHIIRGGFADVPVEMDFTDTSLMRLDNYYYLRATQIDGEMAWSSPIWVRTQLQE